MIQPFTIPRRILPDWLIPEIVENDQRAWDFAWVLNPFVERRRNLRLQPIAVRAWHPHTSVGVFVAFPRRAQLMDAEPAGDDQASDGLLICYGVDL